MKCMQIGKELLNAQEIGKDNFSRISGLLIKYFI